MKFLESRNGSQCMVERDHSDSTGASIQERESRSKTGYAALRRRTVCSPGARIATSITTDHDRCRTPLPAHLASLSEAVCRGRDYACEVLSGRKVLCSRGKPDHR